MLAPLGEAVETTTETLVDRAHPVGTRPTLTVATRTMTGAWKRVRPPDRYAVDV